MTRVAGLNIGETHFGQPLLDGGCAVVGDEGVLVAVSEERLNRSKYSPGFEASLDYCLDYLDAELSDIDTYVFSSCLERPQTDTQLHTYLDGLEVDIPLDRVLINDSHHRSHATSTFFSSPYDDSLILVSDNAGNTLRGEYGRYEFNGMERTSVYIGEKLDIDLLAQYHDDCSELGLGTAYRYVTMYLGFPSYKDAGKVMGLASYGEGHLADYRFFDDDWTCLIENNPYDREGAVRRCLRDQGFDPGKKKRDPASPSELQIEIAWLLQREIERVLVEIVEYYVEQTGIQTLCYAGGVALNCVANQLLLEETNLKELYVQPAAGDSGQCLGNALYGYHCHLGYDRIEPLSNVYLGRKYTPASMRCALERYADRIEYRLSDCVPEFVSEVLANGAIVGHFHGRSEFGPRALGNRSILGDPREGATKDQVNQHIKFRENYRPFAPTILEEFHDEYYDADWQVPCQFMLLAQEVTPSHRADIPAVVHVNGTSRLQTLRREQNSRYYDIIEAFRRRTGVPVVLNTSFNLAGEPIVETPSDALSTFLRSGLDYLVLGDYVVEKRQNADTQ